MNVHGADGEVAKLFRPRERSQIAFPLNFETLANVQRHMKY